MPIAEPVLVDASAIIALINPTTPEHSACVAVGENLPVGKTYTCWPVVTEAAYMLRTNRRYVAQLLTSIDRGWPLLLDLSGKDVAPIQAVIDKYDDQEIDLADAVIVHLANRDDNRAVFTLDPRHFRLFTRSNGTAFRLLPDDFTG